MADQNLNPDKGNNNMLETGSPAFIHLESRVGHLEEDVREIKSGIKTLLDRPQNPGLQQVVGTLLSTLAVCGILMGFAEWRLNVAVYPLKAEIAVLREVEIKSAVLEERSIWMRSQSNWAAKSDRP